MQLADGSEPLVIATTEEISVLDGFPDDWAEMSSEQRRIWQLEAQLLRWERVALAKADDERSEA